MPTVKQTVTALDNAVAELADRAARLTAQLDRALDRAEVAERRLARGTSDHANDLLVAEWSPIPTRPDARPAMPAPDVTEQLQVALRTMPLSTVDAADALGVPVAHVAIALRSLRKAGRIYNVGTSDAPLWSWIIGGEASTTDLMVEVEKLLKLPRPWTLQELVAATGCGHNRISGVRMRLMKAGLRVRNVGNNWRGQWTANPSVR